MQRLTTLWRNVVVVTGLVLVTCRLLKASYLLYSRWPPLERIKVRRRQSLRLTSGKVPKANQSHPSSDWAAVTESLVARKQRITCRVTSRMLVCDSQGSETKAEVHLGLNACLCSRNVFYGGAVSKKDKTLNGLPGMWSSQGGKIKTDCFWYKNASFMTRFNVWTFSDSELELAKTFIFIIRHLACAGWRHNRSDAAKNESYPAAV